MPLMLPPGCGQLQPLAQGVGPCRQPRPGTDRISGPAGRRRPGGGLSCCRQLPARVSWAGCRRVPASGKTPRPSSPSRRRGRPCSRYARPRPSACAAPSAQPACPMLCRPCRKASGAGRPSRNAVPSGRHAAGLRGGALSPVIAG